MTHTVHARRKRLLVITLAVLSVLGLGVAAAGWRVWGAEFVSLFHATVDWVRSLGAGPYFAAFAVLPACGVPISVFNLSAGPLFGPVIGLPWVLVLAALCLAFNITLSYAAARWLLRPWAMRLCKWLGYTLPEVRGEGGTSLVALVRFTPGPPYLLQSLLLGVAGVPFWPYFFISWVATYSYAFALIVFGDALAQGKGGTAMIGISLFIAFAIGIRIVRKQVSARRILREREEIAAASSRIDDTPPPTP
ncbi:TVP38/TMEM64 family protein [Geminisphaera colitermitum]|uniref:TVP38/TMEM64 family protein n=1 Tax=Geminisphaera colitermitum TaxID=1148786 RepID=UPI000196547C|nr:VTT domain-containing protein [Geminisphaera colitermitum]